MNNIETMFYNAWIERGEEEKKRGIRPTRIRPQVPCGGYIIDFVVDYRFQIDTIKVAIEIDGHESHKTKAQRLNDYARERFLMAKRMLVIRFAASEVFVDAAACVNEVWQILYGLDYSFYAYAGKKFDEGIQFEQDWSSGRIRRSLYEPSAVELTE